MTAVTRTLCLTALLGVACTQLTDDDGVLPFDPGKDVRAALVVAPVDMQVTCQPADAANPLPRVFTVRNTGAQALQVHVRSEVPWMSVISSDTLMGIGPSQELTVHLRMPMEVLALTEPQRPLRGVVRVEAADCRPESVVVFLTVSSSADTTKRVRVAPHMAEIERLRGLPGAGVTVLVWWESGPAFTAAVDPGEPWLAVEGAPLAMAAGDTVPRLLTLRAKADSLPPGDSLRAVVRVLPEGSMQGSDSVVVLLRVQKMRRIPAAGDTAFLMGSALMGNEQPVHQVTFAHDFWIDTTEVTEKLYNSLTGVNPSQPPAGPWHPVTRATWFDAAYFCNRRSKALGLDTVYDYSGIQGAAGLGCILSGLTVHLERTGVRLPTEAEWEYACRAGSRTAFFWGELMLPDTLNRYVWYAGNSGGGTHLAATRDPNAFGLFDMAGNVWEWCLDRWRDDYGSAAPVADPVVLPGPAEMVILRGGCFNSVVVAGNPSPAEFRSAYRDSDDPTGQFRSVGFRCVITAR